MSDPFAIILSDCPQLAAGITDRLNDRGECVVCRTPAEVDKLLSKQAARVLISDFRAVADGGHEAARFLETIANSRPELPVILLTGNECPEPLERWAVCGGITHLRGETDFDQLVASVMETLGSVDSASSPEHDSEADEPTETAGSKEKESERHHDESDRASGQVLSGVTRSFETNTPRLRRMLAELEVAARHDVTILLIGETGSGKTYLSRLIHEVSPRRDEPFLHVACGALPDELIESELFGHAKGAFTSAHADKEGKFVAAAGGTVLLDEIDVLGPEQQVKLLRVIETGEFEPVGSNRTLQSRARLVVASNLELEPLVKEGKFRPDLYYRLNMLKFDIPPLRERPDDIRPLAHKFVRDLSEKHGMPVQRIDKSFFEALSRYPWPGNVRELENVVERAVIYCSDGVLRAEHMPPHIREAPPEQFQSAPDQKRAAEAGADLSERIALTEQQIIEQALFRNSFSRTNTARELGISRVTLYNKMKKYGMSQ